MIKRREAIRMAASVSAGVWASAVLRRPGLPAGFFEGKDATPPLAPGAPNSTERRAVIEAFQKQSDGLEKKYEARTYQSGWTMPYRLFRPEASGKLPMILYLSGSGGLGTDNLRQLGLGNVFGTRVWLLPENQKKFPCYVVAPQTDRGWVNYDISNGIDFAKLESGLGEGARLAFEIVEHLCQQFPIDQNRLYVTGQSMGGSGTWHMTAQRPKFFAAAVPVCGADTTEDPVRSMSTPIWNFHGDADQNVPVEMSRDRIAALRKAGGHPLYTEYAGVGHNVWEWAYTEPELPNWLFSHRRA
jgi:predicted peptidase